MTGRWWRRAVGAFAAPVHPGDFPDPCVMVAGDSYWAYSTGSAGRNLQVMRSADLRDWTAPTDPLPVLPAWASPGWTWAPRVTELSGRFVMYYTLRVAALGVQGVSVATADHPAGPFTDHRAAPLVCQADHGGSIDPDVHLDWESGRRFLLWKSDDNSIGRPTHIWARQLAPDGLSFDPGSGPALLLSQTESWQAPRMEGPALLRRDGTFCLFYAANDYATAASGIGYAIAASLPGPFVNRSVDRPWLGSTGRARGPQGPMVFEDLAGDTRMAFAAWTGAVGYRNGGVRALWLGYLEFGPEGEPGVR